MNDCVLQKGVTNMLPFSGVYRKNGSGVFYYIADLFLNIEVSKSQNQLQANLPFLVACLVCSVLPIQMSVVGGSRYASMLLRLKVFFVYI